MAEDNDLARSDILDADNYEELMDDDEYMVDDDDDDDMYFNDEVDTKPIATTRKNSNLTTAPSSTKSKDCYEFQVNNAQIFFKYFIRI